jgi:GNAT superfamily N-acetyltransferase
MEIVELDERAVRGHVTALAQLLFDAHAANMALGVLAPLTQQRAEQAWLELAAKLEPGERVMLAAVEDGAPVGTVHLARAAAENGRHRAEVQRLVVRADARGRGVGSALLEAACDRARELGLTLLWLTTHAGTDSDRFYAARGWTRVGEIASYAALPDGTLGANAFYYRGL